MAHLAKTSHRNALIVLVAASIMILLLFGLTFALSSGFIKQKITHGVTARLGREFTIDGPAKVGWSWSNLKIHAEKIRIANPPGMQEPYFMDIGVLDMKINPWKLLIGKKDIPVMHIQSPRFYFEKTDEDHSNWDFPALSSANTVKNAAIPDNRFDMPVIDNLRVTNGKVIYKNIPRDIDADLNMETVRASENNSSETFSFIGKGSIDKQPLQITAEGGSLELLRDSNQEFPLSVTLKSGDTDFSIKGTFKDPVRLQGLDTDMSLAGGNLADLYYLLHVALPPTPRYALKGHLGKKGDVWTFKGFDGKVGHSDLSGDVVYEQSQGGRPSLKGKLFSTRMDVADLGGFIGLNPGTSKAMKTASADRILPDTPLDLNRLRAGDLDLWLEAKQMNAPGWPLSDMHTHIVLENGVLSLRPMNFGLAGGNVTGFLELDGSKDIPHAKMDFNAKSLKLKQFFKGSSFDKFSAGEMSGRVQLEGSGKSFAKVLGSSNGHVAAILPGGKISLRLIEASDIDIAQLTPLLLGKDKTTNIRCGIGDFDVTNGILRSRIFVLDTEDTNLKGDAKISLKTEALNASLDARPKDKSFLALQSKILLRGNMRHPSVMIDPLSTAARGGGAALLSILTPLAAILPFIELGEGKDSNCRQLIAEAQDGVKK